MIVLGIYGLQNVIHRIPHSGRVCVVTLCFVDSKTGLPVDNALESTQSTNDSQNDVSMAGDLGTLKVTWTDRDDLVIRTAVSGYVPNTVSLNSHSPARLVVPLRQK